MPIAAQTFAFDVVSIKPNKSVDARPSGALQPGRFSQTNVTLMRLVRLAYPERVVGGPAWIDVDRFDVDARGRFDMSAYMPGQSGTQPSVYVMLRALLADRFKLQVHSESQETSVYVLTLARADGRFGPDLRKADVDCMAVMAAIAGGGPRPDPPPPGRAPLCGTQGNPGHIVANGMSMPAFAGLLTRFVDRPVIDRTGLAGDYILELRWTLDQAAGDLPESVFTALQEQLGLTLESSRAPLEVWVVDHAEQPTPD